MQARAEDLGDLLRRLRTRRGLTQEELAERIPDGLSVDTVSNIERGRVRPRRHTLHALLDILEPDEAERNAALETWRLQLRRAADHQPAGLSLPVPPTPLLGRDRELVVLERLLHTAPTRMVTLTGVGGVGKTRLALAAATAVRPAFADGTAFVDLTALRDPDRFLGVVAFSLGLADMGDLPELEQLSAYLRPKHLLLILDNCEAVVAAGPHLASLIERCPFLTVLATSREAMRIRCEQEYRVAPLELPSPEETADPLALELVPAVRLFCERTRMVVPDFTLTAANAATVAEICRRLDGLPLAIELAAARTRHFGTDTLLARLDNALKVLVGGPRDLPERQRALRATLDWSFGLLTADEKKVLRRVSVFVDGFTEPAAASVCHLIAGEFTGTTVDELLTALLDKNLIRSLPSRSDGSAPELRYGMLETIREYSAERLTEVGEAESIRDRHARLYCRLAEQSFAPMYSAARGPWIDTLTLESGNLTAALTWCLESDGEAEVGVRLAGALGRFWYFTGRLNQGREWLAKALLVAGRCSAPARARALYSTAKLAWAQGDYGVASQHAEAGLALAFEIDDEHMNGEFLSLAGYTRMAVGMPERALDAFRRSREIFKAAGDTWQVAFADVMASEALAYIGEHDAASQALEESLTSFQQTGDRWGQAVAHVMTANVSWRRGDVSGLEHHLVHADAIFQELGERYGQSRLRLLHAYLSLAQDNRTEARRLFCEGIGLASELGQSAYSLLILGGCAAIAFLCENYVHAAKLYGRASILLDADAPHVDDGAAAARAAYAQYLPLLRDRLDAGALDAAWSKGRTLSLDDAMDLARSIVCGPDYDGRR
jgi:predicted ATPase/transcriptional regulator with XRE-family HTH domain